MKNVALQMIYIQDCVNNLLELIDFIIARNQHYNIERIQIIKILKITKYRDY